MGSVGSYSVRSQPVILARRWRITTQESRWAKPDRVPRVWILGEYSVKTEPTGSITPTIAKAGPPQIIIASLTTTYSIAHPLSPSFFHLRNNKLSTTLKQYSYLTQLELPQSFQLPNRTTFKMTGGKSGGKASGSKTSQS